MTDENREHLAGARTRVVHCLSFNSESESDTLYFTLFFVRVENMTPVNLKTILYTVQIVEACKKII